MQYSYYRFVINERTIIFVYNLRYDLINESETMFWR